MRFVALLVLARGFGIVFLLDSLIKFVAIFTDDDVDGSEFDICLLELLVLSVLKNLKLSSGVSESGDVFLGFFAIGSADSSFLLMKLETKLSDGSLKLSQI